MILEQNVGNVITLVEYLQLLNLRCFSDQSVEMCQWWYIIYLFPNIKCTTTPYTAYMPVTSLKPIAPSATLEQVDRIRCKCFILCVALS